MKKKQKTVSKAIFALFPIFLGFLYLFLILETSEDYEYLYVVLSLVLVLIFSISSYFTYKEYKSFFITMGIFSVVLVIYSFTRSCDGGGLCGLMPIIILFESIFFYYLPLLLGLGGYFLFKKYFFKN